MDGINEKDCSPLWNLYQQIVGDMKNTAPMWEEFISKASKLHSALKSALGAIAAFLDAFQKIADAATNARGASKDIGTALTRMCLRHRAIETKMKAFITALMDTLIGPLTTKAEEWRRGCNTGALSRDHARECKRARAELRRKVQDAQRCARKARRAPADGRRSADVALQDVQERKQQLEEMEEKAAKAALIEERSRFCHFVTLLNPVVECEVSMLAELGHLQEGSEQLIRHVDEPRTLPPASLQVICDTKSCYKSWQCEVSLPPSPSPSRLGSRKSSLTSICSLNSQTSSAQHGASDSTISCSTPVSNSSSGGTLPLNSDLSRPRCNSQTWRLPSVCSTDSGFRSQDALHRQLSLYVDNGSDNQSVSSEFAANKNNELDRDDDEHHDINNTASATWPELKDTAQFERAASAIMNNRPHTISAAYERNHVRPALSVHTFCEGDVTDRERDKDRDRERERDRERDNIYARPPLPTRCSSLERPSIPVKSNSNTGQQEFKAVKPSSLPPHLIKDMPQALYVNMSELATLAASRAQQQQQQQNNDHPQQEKVCSESSASESSLESSSGYGSQGAFAAEDQALQHHLQQEVIDSEIVILRRDSVDMSVAAARESFSISLGSLEEAVKSLDDCCENSESNFATIAKKPLVPKRRPVSMAATAWSRRGSSTSLTKPPPPVRRSSSISRPQRPPPPQGAVQCPSVGSSDADLPPPPAFLLQPDIEHTGHQTSVAETIKQLNESRHTPASPHLVRRANYTGSNSTLSSFQQQRGHLGTSNTSLNQYGQTGRNLQYALESNAVYLRKSSLNCSTSELYSTGRESATSAQNYHEMSSFSPRPHEGHYGQTGVKLVDDKPSSGGIYARPTTGSVSVCESPLAQRRHRTHSADRRRPDQSSLIASLSAKLAPQLSPRTTRRAISTITQAEGSKGKGSPLEPAFLDKLSLTLQVQHRRHVSSRASHVRDVINTHAQPDPRACHTSLMEQIKRGATLKRNKQCNDRSAPKIR